MIDGVDLTSEELCEKPTSEHDPITGQPYAIHYVIVTIIELARCSGLCTTRLGDSAVVRPSGSVEDPLECFLEEGKVHVS